MQIGYIWLTQLENIFSSPLTQYAEVRSVSRVERIGACLAVPKRVAPSEDSILAHILFALKYEGINLIILSQVLPLISKKELSAAFEQAPSSQYLRRACLLWEYFTQKTLQQQTDISKANYIPLFSPKDYITTAGTKNTKWRVLINGIGNLDYCITVLRTPLVEQLLQTDLFTELNRFLHSLPSELLSRALSWAYLDETQSTFAIEKELPSGNKAQRFVALLKQAHIQRALDEDYLTNLQNSTVDNPFIQAASFRFEQNYLSNGLRGAIGVSYVPPAPELVRELMKHLMQLANEEKTLHPLILASIISFGFVFIHPFMDGNGRLSRFLFHHVLCQNGVLENGVLLPVSAVLKQREAEYKAVLESWSSPTREFWNVEWYDAEDFSFSFRGHDSIYRYWDATQCVEFMFSAVQQAIEKELKEETLYLKKYDTLYEAVNKQFDVISKDLSNLVRHCLDNKGVISKNRRKQYVYKVPAELFDALEQEYRLANL